MKNQVRKLFSIVACGVMVLGLLLAIPTSTKSAHAEAGAFPLSSYVALTVKADLMQESKGGIVQYTSGAGERKFQVIQKDESSDATHPYFIRAQYTDVDQGAVFGWVKESDLEFATEESIIYKKYQHINITTYAWLLSAAKDGEKVGEFIAYDDMNFSVIAFDFRKSATHRVQITNQLGISGWIQSTEITDHSISGYVRYAIGTKVKARQGGWLMSGSKFGYKVGDIDLSEENYTVVNASNYLGQTHVYKISDGKDSTGWVLASEIRSVSDTPEVTGNWLGGRLDPWQFLGEGVWLMSASENGVKIGDSDATHYYRMIDSDPSPNATHPVKVTDGVTTGWILNTEGQYAPRRDDTVGERRKLNDGTWLMSSDISGEKSHEIHTTDYFTVIDDSVSMNAVYKYKVTNGVVTGWVKYSDMGSNLIGNRYQIEKELRSKNPLSIPNNSLVKLSQSSEIMLTPLGGEKVGNADAGVSYCVRRVETDYESNYQFYVTDTNGVVSGWVRIEDIKEVVRNSIFYR